MNPKKTILLLLLLLLAFFAGAQDTRATAHVVKTNSAWGTACEQCHIYDGYKRDHSGTFRITLQNMGRELVDVKVAMQETTGHWRIFPQRSLVPQESMEAFACQGTGKYLYWVRLTDDPEIRMPTDSEIITEYRHR